MVTGPEDSPDPLNAGALLAQQKANYGALDEDLVEMVRQDLREGEEGSSLADRVIESSLKSIQPAEVREGVERLFSWCTVFGEEGVTVPVVVFDVALRPLCIPDSLKLPVLKAKQQLRGWPFKGGSLRLRENSLQVFISAQP